MMILNGLKNYLKNLKYIIVPIGMIFIFFLFSLSIAINGWVSAVNNMVTNVSNLASSITLDLGAFFGAFTEEVSKINWAEFNKAVATVMSKDWLSETFKAAFAKLVDQEILVQITVEINKCVTIIAGYAIFVLVMTLVGLIVGYWATRYAIRSNQAKSKLSKRLIYGSLDLLVSLALIALGLLFYFLWQPTIYFVPIIILILLQMWHVIEAYLEFGKGKVKFTEVFNVKTVLLSIATNLIIIAATVLLTFLLTFILSNIFMLFILIALIEVMMATNSVNTASYVKKYVEDKTNTPNDTPQIENKGEPVKEEKTEKKSKVKKEKRPA